MSSWILLLLLLTSLVRVEGDVLPPSLVDLVENSPISSVDDLKLLLQQVANAEDADEEDEHDFPTNRTHSRFTRSIIDAQPAQQAVCKIRTEVMEVTRSMLDRRNANFILWPRCVEVQRCSGCCNTQQMQCVPLVSASRYLKVTKIQVINRKFHYEQAIISVEDHISCRCQLSSPSSSSSSSVPVLAPRSPNLQQPHHSLPRPVHPPPPKTHSSKADLHRHDDLKHNQQHNPPEEPAARQWQPGSYTQLLHWKQPQGHQVPSYVQPGTHQPGVRGSGLVDGRASEARSEHSITGASTGHGSGIDSSKEDGGGAQMSTSSTDYTDHAHRQQLLLQQKMQYHHRTQYHLNTPQSDSASPLSNPTLLPSTHQNSTSALTTEQKDSVTGRTNSWVTNSTTETSTQRVEKEERGTIVSGDAETATQERLRDSEVTDVGGYITEEERRQKLLEMVQSKPEQEIHLHPNHPQQRPKPTPIQLAPSTVAPLSPSSRRAPFRPASPRRRRKHRKRISKAAIRAMIM